MVAAIAGLDAMVKAAAVRLIHVEKRLGGRLVTVVVVGRQGRDAVVAHRKGLKGLDKVHLHIAFVRCDGGNGIPVQVKHSTNLACLKGSESLKNPRV